MYFLNTLVLYLGTVSAVAVSKPVRGIAVVTANTIIADITDLDNQVKELTTDLNNLNLGLFTLLQALTVSNQFTAVHNSNRQAYNDALLITTAFSDSDSAAIVSLVQKTLVIDNPKAVSICKQKKPIFQLLLQSSTVLSDLKTLMNDHISLSAALMQWVAPSQQQAGTAAVQTITDSLQSAIDYYS
jgi:hypothetical protein